MILIPSFLGCSYQPEIWLLVASVDLLLLACLLVLLQLLGLEECEL